ncbi:MAG TPA: TetR/AcrR family transcriptional regulator [Longilinea sp.]|nr:TetR/AcrR family transcriptional regulator [Longilinea sp.]
MDSTELILEHASEVRILEEGWNLFQQKGYRGVTLDEVCEKSGFSKPTLYYYFHDKETLFVNVLRLKLHGFHEVIEAPGELPMRLERIAAAVLDSFQTEYSALLRDREHIKSPENAAAIRNAFQQEMFAPLNALMQNGIDSGMLSAGNPTMFTLIFLGSINNFINKAAEMGLTNKTLARQLVGYFLSGAQSAQK